jgi:hypothetical protein
MKHSWQKFYVLRRVSLSHQGWIYSASMYGPLPAGRTLESIEGKVLSKKAAVVVPPSCNQNPDTI